MQQTLTRQQMSDRIGRLCATPQPEAHFLGVQLDSGWIGQRIVRAERVDKTTVARGSRVSHDNTVERPFLGSHAFQTDAYCHGRRPFPEKRRPVHRLKKGAETVVDPISLYPSSCLPAFSSIFAFAQT